MDEKDLKNLRKMLKHCENVAVFTEKIKDKNEFEENQMVNSASLFEILQIGELVNNLSKECIEQTSNIPWHKIHALRNRIVHGYAGVDYEIIFETIKKDIPNLLQELKKY